MCRRRACSTAPPLLGLPRVRMAGGWWLVEIDGAVRFLDIVVVATEFIGSMQAEGR